MLVPCWLCWIQLFFHWLTWWLWMSEEWKSAVLNHAILQTITPLPNNSFEQQSYFKSNDYICVFPHHNSSEFKSYRNNLQHLHSEWSLSGLTLFGRSQSLEIQRVFFSWSGTLACGLENCQDAFGHLPGEEDVESFFQFFPGCPFRGW